MAPKTDVIEQLRARIAELEAEVERLSAAHVKACQANADSQAELAKAEQRVAEWQPIETAPKDGTRILVKGDCTIVAGWQFIYSADCYGWAIVNDAWMPERIATHWMPLPTPPSEGGVR